MDLKLSTIGQVSVCVHDLEQAVAFYRDILGMEFLFSVPKMAFFNCDGVRLMLSLPKSPDLIIRDRFSISKQVTSILRTKSS